MKTSAIAALVLSGVALSGCATVIGGTKQPIAVSSTPVTGAYCTLNNGRGGFWTVVTPGTVTVHKAKKDLVIVCKKDGYADATVNVPSHFNGATVGNVLVGGLPGLIVDGATGADYNYPDAADVPMVTGAGTPPGTVAPPPPVAVVPTTSTPGTPAK
ncbi:MAG TPA: hypothetical protein VHU87_03105 [Rhizomicrobium sp.]|jgi:hypothetical protein|nr:hypothetical protein [Rhizomicrobium sp.]